MALTTEQRVAIWRDLMQAGLFPGSIVKGDILAAVNAFDDWIDANAATLNGALPLPYRTAATIPHKFALLAAITKARAEGV